LIAGLKLTRGKFLGQEFELAQLDKLDKETRPLQDANAVSVGATTPQSPVGGLQQILRDATVSPKAALMLLQAEIERQLRLALKSKGYGESTPYQNAINYFSDMPEVPKDFARWLVELRDVRNRIVHGHEATDADALRAIDVGLRILPVIDRIVDKPAGQDQFP
jgi:Domain of unknown function (DUF4145)